MAFAWFNKREKNKNPFVIQRGKIKNGTLGSPSRLEWTEESFIFDKKNKEMVGRNFNLERVYLVGLFLFLFIFVILVRTAWLQIARGEYYYNMAEGNRIRSERIEAKRGVIYDRNNKPLVRNRANFLLYFVPADLPQENELNRIISRISEVLNSTAYQETELSDETATVKVSLTREELEKKIKEDLGKIKPGSAEAYQPLFILDNIPYEKAMLLSLESADWNGVVVTNKISRDYNLSSLSLSHVLGYIGKISPNELKKYGDEYLPIDYVGKTGVEYFWENELKGVNGKKQIEVDALGKEKKIISREEAQDGHNLVLSIDTDLQKKLEDTIAQTLSKLKLTKAAAVMMNPNNGEILALVSFPTYDDNVFARGITAEEYGQLADDPAKPLFDRAVSGEYPSGSTIKPVIAAAALEEKIINENTSFLSTGGIRVGEWFFPDWKAGGHGVTNVRRALAESINTFFYYIGGGYQDFRGLGVEMINKYGKLFGLGTQTGIDLNGEAGGFLPTKEWKEKIKGERWYIGDTYHLAIGQGDLLVTPLQVAAYTAVFANGGSLYRPHLVKEILSRKDNIISRVEAAPVRSKFIDAYNIKIVRQGLRQTVTAGSARSLQSVPVPVAGKTGTAQWSSVKPAHAWFTGFAPYDNPEVVITVLVEEAGEGSSIAAPIARDVLSWYFSQEDL